MDAAQEGVSRRQPPLSASSRARSSLSTWIRDLPARGALDPAAPGAPSRGRRRATADAGVEADQHARLERDERARELNRPARRARRRPARRDGPLRDRAPADAGGRRGRRVPASDCLLAPKSALERLRAALTDGEGSHDEGAVRAADTHPAEPRRDGAFDALFEHARRDAFTRRSRSGSGRTSSRPVRASGTRVRISRRVRRGDGLERSAEGDRALRGRGGSWWRGSRSGRAPRPSRRRRWSGPAVPGQAAAGLRIEGGPPSSSGRICRDAQGEVDRPRRHPGPTLRPPAAGGAGLPPGVSSSVPTGAGAWRLRGAGDSACPRGSPVPGPSEGALLLRARQQLASDPSSALALTDEAGRRFADGALAPEREVLAIEALARTGSPAERAGPPRGLPRGVPALPSSRAPRVPRHALKRRAAKTRKRRNFFFSDQFPLLAAWRLGGSLSSSREPRQRGAWQVPSERRLSTSRSVCEKASPSSSWLRGSGRDASTPVARRTSRTTTSRRRYSWRRENRRSRSP